MKKKNSLKKLTFAKEVLSVLGKKHNQMIFGGEDKKTKLCCTIGLLNSCNAQDSNNAGECDSKAC